MEWYTWIWLGLIVVFTAIEAATVGLVGCWFAIGALIALISDLIGAPPVLQMVWFIVVSGLLLVLTRPIARRYLNAKKRPTNADRVLEMVGVVTEDIDNIAARGAVTIGGKRWTARSLTGEPIPVNTMVHPVMIEGVKLIVEPISQSVQNTTAGI